MANQRLQLLVHAGAPSTRQHDCRYKAQAEAYLSLSQSRGRRLEHAPRGVKQPEMAASSSDAVRKPIRNQNIKATTDPAFADASTYVEDTQLAYTALESQLPTSSRSMVRRTHTPARSKSSRNPAAGTSSTGHVSENSRSSYLVSPQLTRSKQGKRAQQTDYVPKLPRLVGKPHISLPVGHQDQEQRTDGSDKENADQAMLESVESTSELPTSYSLSAGASARSVERPSLPQKSASDPELLAAGLVESAAKSASPAGYLKPPVETVQGHHISKASGIQVSPTRPRKTTDPPITDPARLQGLSSQIFSPGPATSNTPFKTHVTPALQHLVEVSAVAAAFNPIFQARQLQVCERGHWLIQCQHWSLAEQVAFWESLARSVENAGWGVWCTRGDDRQLQTAPQNERSPVTSINAIEEQPFATIRIWCWGEVVKHVYLLLYVASSSKVRKLGLQWIDSNGRVVVQMRQGDA